MGENNLSIIVPALNEESGIGETVNRIKNAVKSIGIKYEIIVVDDGSNDQTAAIAEKAGARVIKHNVNKGYGAAITTGIKDSKYDILCCLDADCTYPPESVPTGHAVRHFTWSAK